jgi:preprotein translocase subunit SecA
MSSASLALGLGIPRGAYPERLEPPPGKLDELGERAAGVVLRRIRARRARAERMARQVDDLGASIAKLSDEGLREVASELRGLLRRDGLRADHVARSFAVVREVAERRLGQRPYDVQVMGGFVLLDGMVAEMETGEGKTLTATLPACTAALAGIPVHVITVNDYLVARDAAGMGPLYEALGLRVGAVQHEMAPDERRAAYACDVTYVSNKDVAFDYLRDRIALGGTPSRIRLELERLGGKGSRADRLLLRGLCFGIVDEADSVLVDEARTPLIISSPEEFDDLEEEVYETALSVAEALEPGRDFSLDARERQVHLTSEGEERVRSATRGLGGLWTGQQRSEEFVRQALSALHLFVRDQHYLVADGRVQIVDEFTGRLMPDRSWERGLHQMVEAKEGCDLTGRRDALAKISYQRFFRRYRRLAGMTGTAREVAGELWSVYGLPVVRIPTNRPLRRREMGHEVYASSDARWRAVVERIQEVHDAGRPVLVGTRSVQASEHLSRLLEEAVLPHRVLNARQDREEAQVVAEAGQPGRITIATNMAGRGTDIRLAPELRETGGLHVIATERHEAARIDRQLFGRCGRQGDTGAYESFASLEDELVRAHASRLGRLLSGRDAGPHSRLHRWLMHHAQRRAERLHSGIRRQLVRMDDQIATMLAFAGRGE